MEKAIETPSTSPIHVENTTSEHQTPPQSQGQQSEHQNSQDSGNDLRKTSTPDRLKVPKAFKYPERHEIRYSRIACSTCGSVSDLKWDDDFLLRLDHQMNSLQSD
ncbi:hypothetical protein Ddye_001839 [Dipteronia dyeriana]|uniref:Uncharacterized protein n=1 Tax=Dipteronia dyeriana TaxID=168575 RepID=A0AAE0CTS2_9ROSI|nr:hypothetical protein Ddye_001839 [Dipteronia dyeriana]